MNEFKDDMHIILESLDISARQLAKDLSFDEPTICNWLNGKFEPDPRSKEDIYSYAYENGMRLNLAYEEPLNTLAKKQGFIHLYHGSKQGLDGEIDINKSYSNNDFGKGFYLGKSLEQSSMFVSDCYKPKVYSFGLFTKNLKVIEFDIDNDWMLTVAYNRNLLGEYKESKKLEKIINKTNGADVIIGPIADNRMIDLINEFTNGYMSDKACRNCLVALDLGKQYVLKSDKAIKKLGFIKEYFLCKNEILDYRMQRNSRQLERVKSIKKIRNQYRDGKYIGDIL